MSEASVMMFAERLNNLFDIITSYSKYNNQELKNDLSKAIITNNPDILHKYINLPDQKASYHPSEITEIASSSKVIGMDSPPKTLQRQRSKKPPSKRLRLQSDTESDTENEDIIEFRTVQHNIEFFSKLYILSS